MSREASEASLALFIRSARWLSSITISKSYLGLPQFWAFHSGGRPLVPTVGFVQSSTTSIGACAPATVANETNRMATRRARMTWLLIDRMGPMIPFGRHGAGSIGAGRQVAVGGAG